MTFRSSWLPSDYEHLDYDCLSPLCQDGSWCRHVVKLVMSRPVWKIIIISINVIIFCFTGYYTTTTTNIMMMRGGATISSLPWRYVQALIKRSQESILLATWLVMMVVTFSLYVLVNMPRVSTYLIKCYSKQTSGEKGELEKTSSSFINHGGGTVATSHFLFC
jgi:hypothetical protein